MSTSSSKRNDLLSLGIVWVLIILYASFFSWFSIRMHQSFQTHAFDLGIFLQSFDNTLKGEGFMYTSLWEGSRFARHFGPTLLLLLPVYYLLPYAETFLFFQSVWLALGALPVYLMAKREIGRWVGVVFALAYLAYPALHGTNLFDFHELSLATTFILFTMYFWGEKRFISAAIFAVLSLLTREDVALAIVPLGIFWLWQRRGKWAILDTETFLASLVVLVGTVWFLLTWQVVIPYFSQGFGYFYTSDYKPEFLLVDMDKKAVYLLHLFLPLVFVPLLDKRVLVTLPLLATGLFTTIDSRYKITNQHPALFVAVVFWAAIYAISRISKLVDKSSEEVKTFLVRNVAPALLVLGLSASFFLSPIHKKGPLAQTPHIRALHEVIDLTVRECETVYTQNAMYPHLVGRTRVYYVEGNKYFFEGWTTPRPKRVTPWSQSVDFECILADIQDSSNILRQTDSATIRRMAQGYGLFVGIDGIYLFKKDYLGEPQVPERVAGYFENGLTVSYYGNPNLEGNAILTDRVPNVDIDWGNKSPLRGFMPEDNFSATFTGYLNTPFPGEYEFEIKHDNGVRLFIDDALVIDSWDREPGTSYKAVLLQAGLHKLRVDYWERVSNASVRLSWIRPDSLQLEVIPEEYFHLAKR